MVETKKKIVKMIEQMAGKYSEYEIFSNWVELGALTYANSCKVIHDKIWHDREKRYIEIMNRYSKEDQQNMITMFGLLHVAFERGMSDILGEIYMESGCGSKANGQFFTPFHLSELNARLQLEGITEEQKLTINEPSTGGGGMIIATAKVLKEKGINYQRCMDVVAQDLDWKGVHMTYLQLSILGIKAIVVQGNTLSEPYVKGYDRNRMFITPAKMGVL